MKPVRFEPVTKSQMRSMSAAERRIVIFKDILAHIAANRWKVLSGTYFGTVYDSPIARSIDGDRRLCEVLKTEPCEGCAMGAIMFATALRFNNVTVQEVGAEGHYRISVRNFSDHLRKYFTKRQSGLIENCFELYLRPQNKYACPCIEYQTARGEAWVNKWILKPPVDRLKEICKNAIRNNGTFVP
jgi:hypothetical protein